MAWPNNPRPAQACVRLREQCDLAAPRRNTSSDGMLASSQHTVANPSSDHEPHVKIGDKRVVTAIDITHDPRNGMDCNQLVESIRASKDTRVKYIIWNNRIMSGTEQKNPAWKWRKYIGRNGHTHHCHISVKKDGCDDTTDWVLKGQVINVEAPEIKWPVLRKGSIGGAVNILQRVLAIKADGIFGEKTEAMVKKFQVQNKLVADGIVGQYTWEALKKAYDGGSIDVIREIQRIV